MGLAYLQSCRNSQPRSVLPVLQVPPLIKNGKQALIHLKGIIYSLRDSTTAISGVEVVFRPIISDSTSLVRRDVTKPDGTYQVYLRSGNRYSISMRKETKSIEIKEINIPAIAVDTGVVIRDFYIDYIDVTEGDGIREPGPMIWFDTNKATIRTLSSNTLENIVRILKYNTNISVLVKGYAEPKELALQKTNRTHYLDKLSQMRADAACAYLLKRGVKLRQLYTANYGARQLAVPNTIPEYRQLNRRVEFHPILDEDLKTIRARGAVPYHPQPAFVKPRVIRKPVRK